jgi:peptidoglycan/LPS O-acetylase OafA/YrhL
MSYFEKGNNQFNVARLLVAIFVVYGHSLSIGPGLDPFSDFMFKSVGVFSASFAVKFFFFLSGILVTKSLFESGPLHYIFARFFRIYPGLIFSLIIVYFLVVPIVDVNIFNNNFFSLKFWKFFYEQITFQTYGKNLNINAMSIGKWTNFNVPLWTLALEVMCYSLLLAIYIVVKGNKWVITFFSLICTIDCILPERYLFLFLPVRDDGISYLPFFFFLGVIFSIWGRNVVIDLKSILSLLILAFLFKSALPGHLIIYMFLIFLFLYVFTRRFMININYTQDISFGIYIYAWPIQMLALHYFSQIEGYFHFILPLFITLFIAFFSWIFIELPGIKLGRRVLNLSFKVLSLK